ncbi:phosphoserine phosphatase SerB [Sphingomonas sp.]|uniref:phosphoserine phosphatase SerB n=1 Tax=Sphingomonas sp. TaxID=28214 RepID=UPI0035C84E00
MYVATIIDAGSLGYGDVNEAWDRLDVAGCQPVEDWNFLDEGDAADIFFETNPASARAALTSESVDVVVQLAEGRAKQLLVADMDSTMITVECIDELADYAGIKPQIAEITERAMRGELDFEAALDARVALLAGLEEAAIDRCRTERVTLMPGARTLVRTMRARGGTAVLVSGGFTRFAEPVAAEIGFDRAIANVLEIADGRLTGAVARPIVGAAAKKAALLDYRASLGISDTATLAVGDGANDLSMIEVAGLGVAYHAKPIVAAAASARIDHNDLTALLWAQGIPRAEWID